MERRSGACLGGLRALILLLSGVLLGGCFPRPEANVAPPLPKAAKGRPEAVGLPGAPSLAPLATPGQVVRAVDVGRRDPFAAVLTARPLLTLDPQSQPGTPAPAKGQGGGQPSTPPPPPAIPKGLLFQGVLRGPQGSEALVQYTPTQPDGGGLRYGSLRVGDVGGRQPDSLLPLGWRVRAIDVERETLVLQSGDTVFTLNL